ncbi:MAG TPA: glycosyltransferase [Candidatus Obscuribacterales bacterium]|jgi:polyisoprenyl-phosphate glycosyltransferase|nr:glycosyltransferase [Candidatus Obscuribacterales bacterium]
MLVATPDLSVVVAVYNEDPRNLIRLLQRLEEVLLVVSIKYEVVFVNDGSGDRTTRALREIAVEFPYVKLINLSRNFGQQAAITAGMDHSDGKAVVNIDSDLQDPPELIPQMMELWRRGYDVIYATRSTRKDSVPKRLFAFLYYRVLSSVSAVEIPRDTGDFRLIDRKVVDALRRLPEKKRFLRGLVPWLGFKQVGIAVDRGAREIGESTYTIRRLLRLAFDGILAFSVAPLFLIPVAGGILGALGLLTLAVAFAVAPAIQPFVFVMAGLLILSGVQVLSTGLVAIYLSTALEELRGRPTYLIQEKLGKGFEGNIATAGFAENRESKLAKEDALAEALSAASSSR